ncbi:hypothetical protein MA16_Dca002497 [Dendrobium catenatum]|uniref:Uncharacterized protein n=1 Tax=Dendrobium catenatum TaxID=906689 RepID=A0A2I0W0Q2_9ASPA|nr:hypothetical protein MA16_Dca002497 [Dendrobium catenatum]
MLSRLKSLVLSAFLVLPAGPETAAEYLCSALKSRRTSSGCKTAAKKHSGGSKELTFFVIIIISLISSKTYFLGPSAFGRSFLHMETNMPSIIPDDWGALLLGSNDSLKDKIEEAINTLGLAVNQERELIKSVSPNQDNYENENDTNLANEDNYGSGSESNTLKHQLGDKEKNEDLKEGEVGSIEIWIHMEELNDSANSMSPPNGKGKNIEEATHEIRGLYLDETGTMHLNYASIYDLNLLDYMSSYSYALNYVLLNILGDLCCAHLDDVKVLLLFRGIFHVLLQFNLRHSRKKKREGSNEATREEKEARKQEEKEEREANEESFLATRLLDHHQTSTQQLTDVGVLPDYQLT